SAPAGLTAMFVPSHVVYDGRFSNNAWLLELPQPITKLTWGNAILISPRTANSFGLEDGDQVELSIDERRLQGPVLTVPGHVDDAVTLPLGFGRAGSESLARGVGFNAFTLRTRERAEFIAGVTLKKLEGTVVLPLAQRH